MMPADAAAGRTPRRGSPDSARHAVSGAAQALSER